MLRSATERRNNDENAKDTRTPSGDTLIQRYFTVSFRQSTDVTFMSSPFITISSAASHTPAGDDRAMAI